MSQGAGAHPSRHVLAAAAVEVHADGRFGNGAAMRVPVLALLHHRTPLDEAVERFLVRACGGDTDTIGAMAGAIWGAYRGLVRDTSRQFHIYRCNVTESAP